MKDYDKISRRRLLIVLLFVLLGFLLIISRLVYLGGISSLKREKQRPVETHIRGEILDCNYNKLGTSLKVYSIFCNPKKVKQPDSEKLKTLSSILNISEKSLKKKLSSNKTFVWLKRKIDYRTQKKITELGIDGIYYTEEFKRFYPNTRLASHILGIVGMDNIGLEGTELYYDKYLNSGWTFSEDNRNFNIVLSIDKNLQYMAESELRKAYRDTKSKSGIVIIMEPSTGYILAMASMPDFDPNNFENSSVYQRKNRAINKAFEPGSIFKIFTTAAIISEKVVQEDEYFDCPGYIKIGDKSISCWKKHNSLNFKEVIRQSCNVGIIKSIFRISKYKFYDYLRGLGLGNYTGIDLPGEVKGTLRLPKKWALFSQASVSIGQEVSTTSIQLISAACAIFNGGKFMQPQILKAIIYSDGRIYKKTAPIFIRQVIPSSVAEQVTRLLKGVVEEGGTGKLAYIKGYSIAGKTGTGEIFDLKLKEYSKDKVNASFIGFIPSENPKYAILVTLHEPKTSDNTGGQVAAPVFKNIVEKIIAYKPIPSEKYILQPQNQTANSWVQHRTNLNNRIELQTKKALPDFTGKNIRQTLKILKILNAKPNLVGSGVAYKQFPAPGSKIYPGIIVTVYFKLPAKKNK